MLRWFGFLLSFAILSTTIPACAESKLPLADPDQPINAALSHDGRYVAFEFHRVSPDWKYRTRRIIGIYDLELNRIEMHVPPGKRHMHSPRFSPDGRFLVHIHYCWETGCGDEEIGTQIALLHLPDRRTRFLTSSRLSIRSGSGRKRDRRVLYGEPTFRTDMSEIYFTYALGPYKDAVGFGNHHESKLLRAAKIGAVNPVSGTTYLFNEDRRAQFKRIENLNNLDNKIIFSGISTQEPNGNLRENELFHFDLKNHKYFAMTPKVAPIINSQISNGQNRLRDFHISNDGTTLIYEKDGNTHIYKNSKYSAISHYELFEDDKKYSGNIEISMSGNGSRIIIWRSNQSDYLWLVDTSTLGVTQKPFRSLIHRALAEHNFDARPSSPPPR